MGNDKMVELARLVYGDNSNQHRYCSRNFGKGETMVHKHYNKFVTPNLLTDMVELARLGVGVEEEGTDEE